MAGSALQKASAALHRRRPALQATVYVAIGLMAMLDMAMLSSSWSSTRFMRASGAFTGLFVVTSAAVTMIASGAFAAAVAVCRRAALHDKAAPWICERATADRVERALCGVMAAWWMAMAMCVSNTAFVFRTEIGRCVSRQFPGRTLPPGVSPDAAAVACSVFRGSLILSWMICAMWLLRAWRVLARGALDFDSQTFPELQSPEAGIDALKPVTAYLVNPDTFSPSAPLAHQPPAGAPSSRASDCDSPGIPGARFRPTTGHAYRCTNQAVQQGYASSGLNPAAARYTVQPGGVAAAPGALGHDGCCQKPRVVGTATLAIEPLEPRAPSPQLDPRGVGRAVPESALY
ncbi:hypothetical protein H4R19_002364 [Coemansia spiralis]|nr:hypothetical protein H4R19_002364 [Coemansia spiralis]